MKIRSIELLEYSPNFGGSLPPIHDDIIFYDGVQAYISKGGPLGYLIANNLSERSDELYSISSVTEQELRDVLAGKIRYTELCCRGAIMADITILMPQDIYEVTYRPVTALDGLASELPRPEYRLSQRAIDEIFEKVARKAEKTVKNHSRDTLF
jgi:hypothetical protein